MTFNTEYNPGAANINGSQSTLLGLWKARREAKEKANLQSRPLRLRRELEFRPGEGFRETGK